MANLTLNCRGVGEGDVSKIEGAHFLLSLVNSTGKSQDTRLNLFGFATAAATKEFIWCLCDPYFVLSSHTRLIPI